MQKCRNAEVRVEASENAAKCNHSLKMWLDIFPTPVMQNAKHAQGIIKKPNQKVQNCQMACPRIEF